MSADTFIGIGKFPDGYRVTGVEQAPDNLIHNPDLETYDEHKDMVKIYFEGTPIFNTIEEARNYAFDISDNYDDDYLSIIEYGISNFTFDFTI